MKPVSRIAESLQMSIGLIPTGKHNYGKSPFFMGKSTISMAIFNSFLYVYQRVALVNVDFTNP
jgi:hypothetical protein